MSVPTRPVLLLALPLSVALLGCSPRNGLEVPSDDSR